MIEYKVLCDETHIDKLKKMFNTNDDAHAITLAIKNALQKQTYNQILSLRGNVEWEGNLGDMRGSRE